MKKFVATPVLALALAGCATVPAALYEEPVSTAQIIAAVQCEMASIYQHQDVAPTLLRYSNALTKLNLVTTDDAGVQPGLGIERKWDGKTVTLTSKNKLSEKAVRTKALDFVTVFANLDPETTLGSSLAADCATLQSAGDELGLADWLHQVLIANKGGAAQFDNLSFIAEFTVTRGAGGGLVFKSDWGSVSLNESQASREKKNRIEVVMKVLPKPSSPARVVPKAAIDELRELQAPVDQGTIIQVEPGQSIIIE